MADWFYVNQGQRSGPVTEDSLTAMLAQRQLSADTLVWRNGMTNWCRAAVSDLASAVPAAPPPLPQATAAVSPPAWHVETPRVPAIQPLFRPAFQSVSGVGKATTIVFWMAAGLIIVQAMIFLSRIQNGQLLSAYNFMKSTVEPIGVLAGLGLIASVILFCIWIFGATRNLQAFGNDDLPITPGWAVGWFFIPIANLWKPYQGLKQLYTLTFLADDGSAVLRWWLCFLFSIALEAIAGGALDDAVLTDRRPDFYVGVVLSLVSDGLSVAAAFLGADVIQKISAQQDARHVAAPRSGAAA